MTKQDVINQIANSTGLRAETARVAVDSFLEVVKESLANGETITLRGFGNFLPVFRPAKKGQHIKKGTTIEIPPCVVPKFKASDEFKAELTGNPVRKKVKKAKLKPIEKEVLPLAEKGDFYKPDGGELWTVYNVKPVEINGKLSDYEYGIYRQTDRRIIRRTISNRNIDGNVIVKGGQDEKA
jgi:DNA-binding protein HU-beta